MFFFYPVLSQPHPAVDSILRRVNDGVEPFPAHRHGARRGGVDPIDRRGSIMGGIGGRSSIVGGIDGSGRFISGSDPLHRHGGSVRGRIDRMSGVGSLDRRLGGVTSLERRGGIIGGIDERGRFTGGVDQLDRHGGIVGGLSGGSGLDRRLGRVDSLGRRGRLIGGLDGSGRFIGGGLDGQGGRGSLFGGRRARTWIGGQSLGTTLGGLGRGTALGGLSTSATSGRICYTRGERPAYDRRGQVEWCSSQYNFCNAPGAVCRLTGWGPRRVGACCHRTGGRKFKSRHHRKNFVF